MAPRNKFTREEMVDAALRVVRAKGMEALTAKAIAEELGISTQPVFTCFNTMDTVKNEVRAAAERIYDGYEAEGLRQKGTLGYFEPEGKDEESKLMDAIRKSDVIKVSDERFSNVDFCQNFTDQLFVQTMSRKGIRFSLCGNEWQTVAPVPNDNVVDAEGAGDWATSQFIACLCEKDILSISKMTEQNIHWCLEKACETASRSVSVLSSKGMIDEVLKGTNCDE